MRHLHRLALLSQLILCAGFLAQPEAVAQVGSWAREVQHVKINPRTGKEEITGSTSSHSDPLKNMLTQITKGPSGVVLSKRQFIMDSKGRIRAGTIWSGNDKLEGRTLYGYDEYDRINEERLFHANGRLIRRMLFRYDANSRRLVDKCYVWNPNDPYGELIETAPSKSDQPLLPVTEEDKELPGVGLPQFRGKTPPPAAGSAPSRATSAPAPAKKPGFFKKLLNRDKN